MIIGQPIEFTGTPYQGAVPREKKILDLNEQHAIDTKIDKLLAKGVIIPSSHKEGEYISQFSLGPKGWLLQDYFKSQVF